VNFSSLLLAFLEVVPILEKGEELLHVVFFVVYEKEDGSELWQEVS